MKEETAETFIKTVAISLILIVAVVISLRFISRAPESEKAVYHRIGDLSLQLEIYRPDGWAPTDLRPSVIWFFGGGWEVGGPAQFTRQAVYMADLGFVSVTPDYRVRSRHGQKTTPFDAASDAMYAVAWVRENAGKLGIDPKRIAVGGGSSGGHLASICALLKSDPSDSSISSLPGSRPNCLLLFNPLLDFDIPVVYQRTNAAQRLDLEEISPIRLVDAALPPTLIIHGSADAIIPIKTSEAFVAKALQVGSKTVKLIRMPGAAHEFYLHGPGARKGFKSSMSEVGSFLTELGWLPRSPLTK